MSPRGRGLASTAARHRGRHRGASLAPSLAPSLALSLAVLAACGSPRTQWSARWRAPYAEFTREEREAFAEARMRLDAGELAGAWEGLDALCLQSPDNLELLIWRQEAEARLLAAGAAPPWPARLAPREPGLTPDEDLRRRYRVAVDTSPSVAGFVLAARAEGDAQEAERLVARALDLDPRCSWAHYARAHALLRQDWKAERWRAARVALEQALALDSGLLRARRLEAWMDAQEGATERAAARLVAWLEEGAEDPRVTEDERVVAELDLAAAWILLGRARDAGDLLTTREGDPRHRERRLLLAAVAAQEVGDLPTALDAARRAGDAAPDALLPLVQQALLFGQGLGETDAARERWERVAEHAAGRGDLAAMMQGLRARVELERTAESAPR